MAARWLLRPLTWAAPQMLSLILLKLSPCLLYTSVISSVLALLFVLPFSRVSLYMAILISFFGVYIFATYRQRTVGGLDDACYGASCAWAEILFLLAWMTFDRFL